MLHTCFTHTYTHTYALVSYHIYSHQFVNTLYLKGHYHCFSIAILPFAIAQRLTYMAAAVAEAAAAHICIVSGVLFINKECIN